MKVFACNIPFATSVGALRALFSKYGQVKFVKIHFDQATNLPLGRAMVTMRFTEDAERAVSELHGSTFGGRQLVCCLQRKSFEREEQDNVDTHRQTVC